MTAIANNVVASTLRDAETAQDLLKLLDLIPLQNIKNFIKQELEQGEVSNAELYESVQSTRYYQMI